jgi:hypothetical protein
MFFEHAAPADHVSGVSVARPVEGSASNAQLFIDMDVFAFNASVADQVNGRRQPCDASANNVMLF